MDYIGLDSLEIMVQEASRRTREVVLCRDILHDPLPAAEYYVCSGALNILTQDAALFFIERCYNASLRGVIFNFLEGNKASEMFNYLLESDIKAFGEKLGAKVAFRRHYYENDCTAAFYKS